MKPMLAATIKDVAKVRFPVFASPKLDGVRAIILEGDALSRKLRRFDNEFTQRWFSQEDFSGMDGELIQGRPTDYDVFNVTSGAARRISGKPRLTFYVFDDFTHPHIDYINRVTGLKQRVAKLPGYTRVKYLEQTMLHNLEELDAFENKVLTLGYEGVMLRDPVGHYKFGRSTMNEQYLMKLKRFEIDTGQIVGFEEEMQNLNPQTLNAAGKKQRSKHQSGMVGKSTLGAFIVTATSGPYKGVTFNATGISAELKKKIWDNRYSYMGKSIKFQWFPVGSKDKPRFPTFKDFV